jgi:hypothetical protein
MISGMNKSIFKGCSAGISKEWSCRMNFSLNALPKNVSKPAWRSV